MKVKQTTRVLSPIMRDVRDSLQKVCEIDKYELKDDVHAVVGWTIPKSLMSVTKFLDQITVNGYSRVARSVSDAGGFQYENFTYKYQEKSLLIGISVFEDSFSIEVK